MSGNDEFLAALAGFEQENTDKVEHRLYYNKVTGEALFLTCEKPDGDYVVVTKEEHETLRMAYTRVKDGKIKNLELSPECTLRLQRADHGRWRTCKNNMIFVTDNDNDCDYYEIRTTNDE